MMIQVLRNLTGKGNGIFIVFLLITSILAGGCNQEVRPPSIILVITDDQGFGDLGCTGNPYIQTPAIDRFSNESVMFTNFHVSTTCAPTRGALMTGRHTNRLNVFHTISGRSLLFEDELLLPEVLSQNGYINGMFGKWHLGDNYPFRPEDRGFDEVVRHGGGGITQGPDYWGNDYFDDHYWHNGIPEKYNGYCTDVFFDEALRFISENKDRPFFCYISTNAPHGPHNLPMKYLEMYLGHDSIPNRQERFYGMITNIDDNFQRLRNKIEELELTENTILVFMTDNGTGGGQVVYDAGLRGKKGSEYEGGHRVPLMISWPAKNIGGGRKVNDLVAHFDLLPTLTDLCGIRFEEKKPLDGISFKSLLTDTSADWPDRILYVDTQRLQNLVKGRKYSVMRQGWRLVNGTELYDLSSDLKQTTNVIEDHPGLADELKNGYEQWWSSIMSEKPNERYAYIKAGTDFENPVRISAHDMLSSNAGRSWHQYGAATADQATGIWKIEIAEEGEYRISLRRYPRESGLAIDTSFQEARKIPQLDQVMPASRDANFQKAFLYIAGYQGTKPVNPGDSEINFQTHLPSGKFDVTASFIDSDERWYPAYYMYIEKL